MRIIPVIDLKAGVAVRGVAGRREDYRPIVSRLTSSAQPVEVARAFRDCLGCTELYLADLDAIGGGGPAWSAYQRIGGLGLRLWVDAGIRTTEQAEALASVDVPQVVVGLETLAGPDELAAILETISARRVVFSLDLRDGAPLGDTHKWDELEALAIARQACRLGVRSLILLDLARVGLGQGLGTEPLCRQLRDEHPDLELILGGGVRGMEDLNELAACGASAVLVASALHDGRITQEHINRLDAIHGSPTGPDLPPPRPALGPG